nr:hypothetical protein [Tanacetum cinerariifolium]
MNFQPVTVRNQSNPIAGSKNPHNTNDDATFEIKEPEFEGKKPESEVYVSLSSSAKTKKHGDKTKREAKGKSPVELSTGFRNLCEEFEDFLKSPAGPSNTAVSPTLKKSLYVDTSQYPDDSNMPALEDIIYSDDEEDVDAEADFTNLETTITVSPILSTRVHKDHLVTQIISDLSSVTKTMSMTRMVKDQGGLTQINNEDFHTCMFACFLSQKEPKRVHQALKDPSWIEAMQEELLQFKMQKVWVLVDLPNGKRAIDTKWTQEKGIDYEEVFAPVARIETIRLFLAYAFFMGFMVYQMDVKSAFLYETIEEEVYVCQPLGFEDPDYPDKLSFREWFSKGKDRSDLVRQEAKKKPDGIFISQDKYVVEILRKFGLTDGKSASTPIDTEKPLLKDPDVKRIFRYLKGKPHLGLWYPKDLPFNLVAYSDSDYAGASLDMKSTTGGCQFLGCRLISWQCKKQIVVATSSTEAEYVAAASCCAQVLWIQNQLLNYRLCFLGFGLTMQVIQSGAIKYALIVNPNIYVSFIKQFWSSVSIKKVNDVVRLQALIDRKKVIITEATVREALRLDDAESIDCLTNEEIFTELARMGTVWNEFSSFMASAVICLSTGRKFNFSKYIFDSLVRNVDSSSKFYMYPRFLQLMIRAQVGDLSFHTTKYSSPTLTQKVFINIRMVGKGFSRVETPLIEGMLVPQQDADAVDDVVADSVPTDDVADDINAANAEPNPPSPPPTTTPLRLQELPSTSQVVPTPPPSPIAQQSSPLQQQQPSQPTIISLDLLNNLLETCTALTRRVENLEQDKIAQALEITKIESSADIVMDDQEDASKQGEIISNIYAYEDVTLKDVVVVDKEVEVENNVKVEKNAHVQGRLEESKAKVNHIDLEHADKVLSMQDDEPEPAELQKVIEVVTTVKLMTEVVTAATTTITTAPITIDTITATPSAARRRKRVVIRDLEETATPSTIIHSEPKSKDKGKRIMVQEPKPLKKQAQIEKDEAYARELEAELNKNINWDDVIDQVQRKKKEDNVVLRYQALKRKPQTEAQARKNMIVYLKNMVGFKIYYFKGMSNNAIRPIFEKYFNSNVTFLEKSKEELEEEESRALKRKTKSFKEKAAKKQKLDEKVEELKKHLQIMPNDDDDVYTEATPLALKVTVIDYEIYTENNKPYYKIIRADGSHQLCLSFLSLLRNFDKEDLEVLWQIVKEIFASSKPKNFSDDFLLTTLTYMFEKPDVEAQMILLVERRYALTRFTFEQMLNNVRLKVEETYCCWLKLKLLLDAADIKLRLLEQSVAAEDPIRLMNVSRTPIRAGSQGFKDLLSHKEKLKKAASSVKLTEECSVIIQRSLPQKERNPGSFTLPCLIGPLAVKNSLADLGASINLMPHYLFQRLRIYKLKPTKMSIQLADRSIKYPIRVCENLLVKISKFIFPVDFVVLEINEDELVPIILGRPFLTMARAVIDVHKEKLSLRVRSETVTFNIGKSLKSKHSHHDGEWTKEEERDDPNKVFAVSFYPRTETVESLKWKALENRLKPSSVEPPKLKLKGLLENLELLEVLRNHKGAITWTIADIKGIDLSFCTHKILMEDEFKPSSLGKPVQVVLKKGGMTVVKNEKDELILQRTVTEWRELIKDSMEVFMDDLSIFGSSFDHCLKNLEKLLKRCEETNLVLNWEKFHFMVKEGIVLGHKVSSSRIEEFDIEIRDKKGAENMAVDHLSRLENPDHEKLTRAEIKDLFPEERLMAIFDKNNEP